MNLRLPKAIDDTYTVYAISPFDQTPSPVLLRSRSDLENFRVAYQSALARILAEHGMLKLVEFFPIVPAPAAVLCGRELLSKVHPALRVYDWSKATGGFTSHIIVNGSENYQAS